jgi:N-acetylglutamate synthase-like GNAT family acetyltransferase
MTKKEIKIQPASRADAAVLANIVRASFQDVADRLKVTPENCPVFVAFIQPDRVRKEMDEGTQFYFAHVDGRRVGCVGMQPMNDDECKLRRLAVMPDHRHHGLGRMLVEHVLTLARRRKMQRVVLGMVYKCVRLRKWYESFGFTTTHKKQFDHIPFDVAYMKCELKGTHQ